MDIKSRVQQWDEAWDADIEAFGNTRVPSFSTVLRRIEILSYCGYDHYDGSLPGSFFQRLPQWLDQFQEQEQQFAFLAASRILFVTWEQITSLQKQIYERKVRRLLLESMLKAKNLPLYRHDLVVGEYESVVKECLFVALSDSASLNAFMHTNSTDLGRPQSPQKRLIGPSVDLLVQPSKIAKKDPEVAELAAEYRAAFTRISLTGKRFLFILEDFAGSGQTASTDLLRLADDYPQFEKIVFCPYICTEQAKETITKETNRVKERIEVAEGMLLPTKAKVFENDCYLWQEHDIPLKDANLGDELKRICDKYWERCHIQENETYEDYPASIRIYAGGYRDCQLLVVLESNCPNNSLPIIWSSAADTVDIWYPLFPRFPRY